MISKKKFFVIVLLSLFVLIIGTWVSIGVINRQSKKEIGKFISTVNLTTLQGIHSWADRHYSVSKHAAHELSLFINELVSHKMATVNLAESSIQMQLSSFFVFEEYKGYTIVNNDNMVLSSSNGNCIGKQNALQGQDNILGRIWKGETIISNPFYTKCDGDGKSLIMFVGTPIKDDSNAITAILILTINPFKNLMKIFKEGRIGNSGENYAIDMTGRLLSKSRFPDQLNSDGLIKSGESEILNSSVLALNAISPNNNNKRILFSDSLPLSGLDSHYYASISSMDLDGYSDYRGVNVVGVITWDDELNMGVVTEIDADEAFRVFNRIQSAIMILFFIWIVVFILVSATFYNWYKSLAQKENIYKDFYNNSPLGIYQSSPSGVFVKANQSLLDMMRYDSLSDLQTLDLEKDGYSKESSITRKEFKEMIERDGFVKGIEGAWNITGGQTIHIRENARAIRDNKGKTLYYEGTIEDISKRKKVEEELVLAKEKAEESDRLKSAFLANLSHEIRTPMNGIVGFAEILKQPELQEIEKLEFIDIIQTCGNQLLEIIDDLVDVSRIESGQMGVSITEININELFDYFYTFFKPEVDSKGIQLSFNNPFSEKESIIETDYDKIRVIFNNLIENAIKYSNDGSIEIGYEKNDKYLEFFVKDTGIGIYNEKKEIIFERFRQANESSSREYDGAGLGLSITKGYVELLGGRIWVESEVGKGSVFYFTIPNNTNLNKKIVTENVDSNY